ncbi:MAG TPA: ATP-binding protein [Chroococcales cyanobacterium]
MKLLQKGVLIVALPLCLQGTFYLVLKNELARTASQAQDLEVSQKIVISVNNYILDLGNMFDILARCCIEPDDSLTGIMARLISKIKQRTADISAMLTDEAQEPEEAQKVRELADTFVSESIRVQKSLNGRQLGLSRLQQFNASARFKVSATALADYLTNIAAREEGKCATARQNGEVLRGQIRTWLDIAAALNTLVAVFLAVFFVKGTVQHLSVLKENAKRVSANAPLLDRIKGADEIAEVDKVFHEMADALKVAVDRENEMFRVLRSSERRLQSVINALPIALLVTDKVGQIESINPQAEQLFSLTSAEMVGKPLSSLITPHQKGAPEFPVEQLLKDSLVRPTPMEGLSKDSRVIPVEVSLTAFESAQGERILATVIDVTERQKLEKLKSDFVAMVSHDIRTPLASIRAVLEMTSCGRLGNVTSEMEQQLNSAMSATDRLLALVKRLLDIEKLEAGLVQLSPRKFSIKELYRIALPMVSQYANERDVTIEMEDNSSGEAFADIDAISQVLINLLSNAIRYAPEDSDVWVIAEDDKNGDGSSQDNGGRIRISVKDSGPGIEKENLEKLFERFKQLGAKKERQGGFGLGLAICKSIVEQHGEKIGVDSTVGEGSSFWFTLAKSESQV